MTAMNPLARTHAALTEQPEDLELGKERSQFLGFGRDEGGGFGLAGLGRGGRGFRGEARLEQAFRTKPLGRVGR